MDRRPLIRALGAAWLVLAFLLIACLVTELALRIERRRSEMAAERYRKGDVFFSHQRQIHATDYSLWLKPWFKYRPGARLELRAGAETFTVQINSRGYRTREFAVPKPKGVVRIACIGGSTTVAGRTNDQTYPAHLERLLRARHPGLPIEVLNLGVSGVTSEYWYSRLDRVFAFEPDVVVQYEGMNDIAWLHLPRFAREHPFLRQAYRSLLFERLHPFPVDQFEPELMRTLQTLDATAAACRARGIGYLLGSFAGPDLSRASDEFRRQLDVETALWTRSFPLHSARSYAAMLARYNELLVAFAWRRHLPHVLVHEHLDDPALFIDSCHFTEEGIRRLAEEMDRGVESLISDAPGFRRAVGRGDASGRCDAPPDQ